MKLRAVAAVAVVVLWGVTMGCSGGAKAGKAQGQTADTATSAAVPAGASGGDSIGIPECDNYMKRYRECIESKVPEAARATVRQSLDQATSAWKQAAATPAARSGLAQACQQATDAAKTAMQAYGCSF